MANGGRPQDTKKLNSQQLVDCPGCKIENITNENYLNEKDTGDFGVKEHVFNMPGESMMPPRCSFIKAFGDATRPMLASHHGIWVVTL